MAFLWTEFCLVDGNPRADGFLFRLQEKTAGVVRHPSAEAQAQRRVKAQEEFFSRRSLRFKTPCSIFWLHDV